MSIHLHDTTLYNSIYRFDDELLVNTHVWGWNAYGRRFCISAASPEAVCPPPTLKL